MLEYTHIDLEWKAELMLTLSGQKAAGFLLGAGGLDSCLERTCLTSLDESLSCFISPVSEDDLLDSLRFAGTSSDMVQSLLSIELGVAKASKWTLGARQISIQKSKEGFEN